MNTPAFSRSSTPRPDRLRAAPSRNLLIALAVVALHVGFIWALQTGLLMRAAEIVVPAEVLSQFLEAPAARPAPAPPAPAAPAVPVVQKKPVARAAAQPQAQPLAVTDPDPSPNAASSVVAAAASPAAAAAPGAPAAAGGGQGTVQLPSSDADYLQNPKPPYPPLSERLGEQGKVVYKVLIGVDGKAQSAVLVSSSGFPRLDKAAYDTVMRWRYVPGKRGGVPEAMSFNVPINWELKN